METIEEIKMAESMRIRCVNCYKMLEITADDVDNRVRDPVRCPCCRRTNCLKPRLVRLVLPFHN